MKQATLNLNLNVKKTRKQVLLDQMELVVPWACLVELIAPYYPNAANLVNIRQTRNPNLSVNSPTERCRFFCRSEQRRLVI